jgi:glucose/arabinose dehydrogenase
LGNYQFTGWKIFNYRKTGYMNVVSADGKQISKIEGFPKVDSKGQGGMLDVLLIRFQIK